ncbi:MAG: M20/M25/M40 family metallo-hydrolase [Pseudotabrizicola sp.]|uniref:M28 family metallopeptidase n=1 Tax=Pseudotabrizicola sp. TaxID=2939647 RepID=UPI00271D3F60|nr:M20/M25/M40 family metallo-hydrolase [Pseudotabrizicola sp.]MDO8881379.1 M20/M25/M40 family metallo-hydrolase [Pseudotabrizicola sp.]MDP2081292.1 M20/M25/M40 family metallo-hydrolase [Pseudotabrizicola sp.]MDZ7576089.1 M20/M25/M40 family metallo-hydrolase [Pseudotabrizicola sp.]
MTPITKAIVILDQASGALRMDEDERPVGLDLIPDLTFLTRSSSELSLEITLAVPGLEGGGVDGLADGFTAPHGLRIMALPPLEYGVPIGLHGAAGGDTALVAADRRLRGEAAAAGLVPAPHVALLPMMSLGHRPVAARLTGPKAALETLVRQGDVVPMWFQPAPEKPDRWALIALLSPPRLTDALTGGLTLQSLGYDPLTEDLFWARPGDDRAELDEALKIRRVLYAEPGQFLIAMRPEEQAEAFHVHGAHGHSEFLVPDPGLLRPTQAEAVEFESQEIGAIPKILEPVEISPAIRKAILLLRPTCRAVTAHYATDLDRYTGATPIDAQGAIVSRHSAHPDNKRAEAQLMRDLRAMGYCAYRHDFTHAGATHSNIIADLPGQGKLRIKPHILEKYREILRRPLPRPFQPFLDDLAEIFEVSGDSDLSTFPEPMIRAEIERVLKLQPWYPWWQPKCPLPGLGAGIIVVGAHMDSTAGFDPGYHAPTDAAPGCDDNGSGLAAVLSIARWFRGLQGKLTHTVRFCFFNAEESGLVGSKAYAAHLKAMRAPIRGVVCADMMGFNSDANRLFEVHAGYTDPAIRDLSDPLATQLAAAAAEYGALAPAQIYRGTSTFGGPDRNVYDGAINRSDHAAFHQQGWGAVLASEDFFANLASEPASDPNPHYHRQSDQIVDTLYARDITCAVARMVTKLAA